MGDQTFNCWWSTYPHTHARAGQAVEVITREAYDGKVIQLQRMIGKIPLEMQARIMRDCDAEDEEEGR